MVLEKIGDIFEENQLCSRGFSWLTLIITVFGPREGYNFKQHTSSFHQTSLDRFCFVDSALSVFHMYVYDGECGYGCSNLRFKGDEVTLSMVNLYQVIPPICSWISTISFLHLEDWGTWDLKLQMMTMLTTSQIIDLPMWWYGQHISSIAVSLSYVCFGSLLW